MGGTKRTALEEARKAQALRDSAPELLEAYRALWVAVEDGTLERDFFPLRQQFRDVVDKAEGR